MPEISRFFRIIITLYYNDYLPPHFHIRYDLKKAIVDIQNPAILEGYLSRRVFNLVKEWATEYQTKLLANWNLPAKRNP
jgi:hypothetical protein